MGIRRNTNLSGQTSMIDTGAREARDKEWEVLKARASGYPPNVKLSSTRADTSEEMKTVVARLSSIRIDFAMIGARGTRAWCRVMRPGTPEVEMFDTGEVLADTARKRLARFLSQQIVLEATRAAGAAGQ